MQVASNGVRSGLTDMRKKTFDHMVQVQFTTPDVIADLVSIACTQYNDPPLSLQKIVDGHSMQGYRVTPPKTSNQAPLGPLNRAVDMTSCIQKVKSGIDPGPICSWPRHIIIREHNIHN